MTFPLPGANWGNLHSLHLVASTGIDGYALQDAAAGVVSWLVPDDGVLHRAIVSTQLLVQADEVGGQIAIGVCDPGGVGHTLEVMPSDQPALSSINPTQSAFYNSTSGYLLVAPNSIVSCFQASALTGGSATLWAEIWGL